MEPPVSPPRRPRHVVAALVALCSPLAACGGPPATTTVTTADWCWSHYGLAPTGALMADSGPGSASDADAWATWLGRTADAPPERRDAHRVQRELVDVLLTTGTWTDAQRARYQSAAGSDPTPATVCETVGARILVEDDGTLPSGWQERFLDPNDPAHSGAAAADAGAER